MKKIAVVIFSVLIAACSSVQKSDSPKAAEAGDKITASTATTNAVTPSADVESAKLAAEIQGLQHQSVYFDLDKSAIKPEYRNVILKQAEFIKAHKNDIVTVQGNTDERGSSEYNLALGDRRASVAQQSLELLGVPAAQIRTVSFGLEKPRLSCHEERCWKENRRDDFVHQLN